MTSCSVFPLNWAALSLAVSLPKGLKSRIGLEGGSERVVLEREMDGQNPADGQTTVLSPLGPLQLFSALASQAELGSFVATRAQIDIVPPLK